jgi:TadE-like protein
VIHFSHRPLRVIFPPLWGDDRAAQIVEFAVALPLMVVFVVGIFDFSGAFTLRQKLTNVARDAARAAASDPGTDFTAPPSSLMPASISDGFQVIDNYLIANHLSDCGINNTFTFAVMGPSVTQWTLAATNGPPPCSVIIHINRGYYFPQNSTTLPDPLTCGNSVAAGAGQITVIATCVSIQYAYTWRFGRVASLFGSTTTLPTMITATAVAMNEN